MQLIRSKIVKASLIFLILLALTLIALRIFPAASFSDLAPSSRVVLADDGGVLRLTLADDGQYRLWQKLENISPSMVEIMLLKEDRYFYYHFGVNPIALARATIATYIGGDRQGASTITMQLTRRVYGINSRSILGKIQQIIAATWLESRYSKHDILEAYLNLAPMGGNIEGVAAASQIYFHKEASELSISDSLSLAVMPQSPARRAHFSNSFQAARDRLTQLWIENNPNNPLKTSIMHLTSIGKPRQSLPFIAPHFTRRELKNSDRKVINTTLNIELQQLLKHQISRYINNQREVKNIQNAAAIVVDTRDQAVKAWVGSADFFDNSIQGQVDGVTSSRSPGSTLKPFLYALAMDQGVIIPSSILKDSPTAFGAFEPENYDRRFVGPITASDALVRSRNVPAVWLANQIHHPDLYEFLKQAKVKGMRSRRHYGLALALGGGEISMLELARLYTMLANQGLYYPIRTESQQVVAPPSENLLSEASSFLVLDILQNNPRFDGLPNNRWKVAWKTGTSWGFHDAWAAAVTGPYVVVVWIGNFDATPNQAFIGADAAGPLLFSVTDALEAKQTHIATQRLAAPKSVKKVKICTESGRLPNKWCPAMSEEWFIPGVSPIQKSQLHQPIWVDNKTGQAVCPPYDASTQHQAVFAFWSSEMIRLFEQAGLPRRAPPSPPKACAIKTHDMGTEPIIRLPLKGVTYQLLRSKPEETIPFKADSIENEATLFWFADAIFLGKTAANQIIDWRPERSGHYTILVTDQFGNSSSRLLNVLISRD